MLQTPILFLIFNRPSTTKRVFEQISKIKPKLLFIAADGPRNNYPDDIEKCQQTRKIVEKIDWDCEVKTLFRDKNLGCKYGVSAAIDWFFENVDEGIILEDDCLPDPSFFSFCQSLLEKYRNDKRVMHISGDNFQNGIQRGDGSYYFSRYVHVWGWATWRRAWKHYDVTMSKFPSFRDGDKINKIFKNLDEQNFWLGNFNSVFENRIDTWDYQWVFAVMNINALSIIPNHNLVSNIGFQIDATHTKTSNPLVESLPIFPITRLDYPKNMLVDEAADDYSYSHIINPNHKREFSINYLFTTIKRLFI